MKDERIRRFATDILLIVCTVALLLLIIRDVRQYTGARYDHVTVHAAQPEAGTPHGNSNMPGSGTPHGESDFTGIYGQNEIPEEPVCST